MGGLAAMESKLLHRAAVLWLLCLFWRSPVCRANKEVSVSRRLSYELPEDFYNSRCDPCIARNSYTILVMGVEDRDWVMIRSAMEQASRDTFVNLEFQTFQNNQDSVLDMADTIVERSYKDRPAALIINFPEAIRLSILESAVKAALRNGLPVFGYGAGYQRAPEMGILGHVAQDERTAGRMVADTLMERLKEREFSFSNDTRRNLFEFSSTTRPKKALFVASNSSSVKMHVHERYEGLQAAFQHYANSNISAVQFNNTLGNTSLGLVQFHIDVHLDAAVLQHPDSLFDTTFEERKPEDIALGCQYDLMILEGDQTINMVMAALERAACTDTLVAVFSDGALSHETRQRMIRKQIALAAVPNIYLQSVLTVAMASVFATTGKKLALPMDSGGVFLSGPRIIELAIRDKLPEDSITNCERYAFPICDPDTETSKTAIRPYPTSIFNNPPPLQQSSTRICNEEGCIRRSKIRLAGVLHGSSTSLFWKPIYASARQTALDLGVSLEMEIRDPGLSREVYYAKMGYRIRSYCESGVDGIIVTIPNEVLLDAIRFCQGLLVPVVSVNSGAEFAKQLGLMAHIGQDEYNAGYGGGQRLIREGIKEGYCLVHSLGNTALLDRCRGMEDALAEVDDVIYRGYVEVAGDDVARYKVNVEMAVAERSGDIDPSWEGIGLLSLSTSNVNAALHVLDEHPKLILGTFDVGENIYGPLAEGRLQFGIDQQALLQGIMPVYLLTYAAYTKQQLLTTLVETGPHFQDKAPTSDQEVCENNYFNVCKEVPYEEMNHIFPAMVGVGDFLVALTLCACAGCVAWTLYYSNKSELVQVSQPHFLIALVGGIAISTLSIIFMAVETDYPYVKSVHTGLLTDEENPEIRKANASCMAVYWLQGIGNAIAFVSLFSKIWKIQMIYKAGERFRRIQVGFKDILPYGSVLMLVVFGILISWQVVDPFVWTRTVELEDNDGLALESYGECSSDLGWYFLVALLCFQLVYLVYALVLCWQTKDIPTDFAESNYVSLCVMCIFQVSILAIPIAAMVRDDSTAFYFVRACANFLQNFTVLCLMFIPKMWRVFQGQDQLALIRHGSFDPSNEFRNVRLSGNHSGQFSTQSCPASGQCHPSHDRAKESWRRNSHVSMKSLRNNLSTSSYVPNGSSSLFAPNGSTSEYVSESSPAFPIEAEVRRADKLGDSEAELNEHTFQTEKDMYEHGGEEIEDIQEGELEQQQRRPEQQEEESQEIVFYREESEPGEEGDIQSKVNRILDSDTQPVRLE